MTSNEINERFAALEAQIATECVQAQADRQTVARTRRQMRVTWAISALTALAMFTMGWHKDAIAQGYGITLAQAATRISALETKTASMSVVAASDSSNTSGQQTVRFTGINVQIVDGTGATEGTQTGVGNLIIGYNELRGSSSDSRTGNHNLIAGLQNSYSGNGGVVFGHRNNVRNTESSVLGGYGNTASGSQASVLGGSLNGASGDYSSVSGGYANSASGGYSTISGGINNGASGDSSSVSGGNGNRASGGYSTISGGPNRTVSTDGGWVAGRFTGTSYTGYFNSP